MCQSVALAVALYYRADLPPAQFIIKLMATDTYLTYEQAEKLIGGC